MAYPTLRPIGSESESTPLLSEKQTFGVGRTLCTTFCGCIGLLYLIYVAFVVVRFPEFALQNTNGNRISNLDYEMWEQMYLWPRVIPNDKVLTVGGNIGTSCIFVDHVLSNTRGSQLCVEPNPAILPRLRQNRDAAGAHFEILDAVLRRTLKGTKKIENVMFEKGGLAGKVITNATLATADSDRVSVPAIDRDLSSFTALLIDCEGCFCALFQQFPELLQARMVVLEEDGQCSYDVVQLLKEHGLNLVQASSWYHFNFGVDHKVFERGTSVVWQQWEKLATITLFLLLGFRILFVMILPDGVAPGLLIFALLQVSPVMFYACWALCVRRRKMTSMST